MLLALFYGMPGWGEILIIGAVGLLFFGGRRLPELGKSLGKSVVAFKHGLTGVGDDDGQAGPSGDSTPPQKIDSTKQDR